MSAKVTLIIPTFNMASTLDRAINSVLSQAYSDLEIIIVDDGSSDNTKEVVAKASEFSPERILYLQNEFNQGRGAALNLGINKATGDFIAFLDADETLPKNSLQDRVSFLEFNPHLDAVFSDTNFQDGNGNTYTVRSPPKNRTQQELAFAFLAAIKTPFHLMSVMYRVSAFEKTGFFNPEYRKAQDIDFAYRLLSNGKLGYLPRPTYNYTATSHSLSTSLNNRFKLLSYRTRIICSHTQEIQQAYLLAFNFLVQIAKLGYDIYAHGRYSKS